MLTRFMSAVIEIISSHPVCLELYTNYRGLGRLTLRDEGTTVLAGMVISLIN
jgi:translation elongation factor EF-1alpha